MYSYIAKSVSNYHLGSINDLCYIQNRVRTNRVLLLVNKGRCDTSKKYHFAVPHENNAFKNFACASLICIVSTFLPFSLISRIYCKMTPD